MKIMDKKHIGFNFLHNHPKMEQVLKLDSEHIIIDKKDWEEVIKYFNDNPIELSKIKQQETISNKDKEFIVIGTLSKKFGYNGFMPIEIGTDVYLHEDKYCFYMKPLSGDTPVLQIFYKEDLFPHINFINK